MPAGSWRASPHGQSPERRRRSLRQLDPKICAERKLDIQVFNLQLAEGKTFQNHSETLDYMAPSTSR